MKLSELFEGKLEDREMADDFIHAWTYEPQQDMEGAKIALMVYPYKRRGKLYRGLSFKTKSEYEKFKNDTHGFTTLSEKKVSSWSPDVEHAAAYAMIDDEYDDPGHAGVIISTMAEDIGKIDPSKSPRGESSEIILMPGVMQISLVKEKIQ